MIALITSRSEGKKILDYKMSKTETTKKKKKITTKLNFIPIYKKNMAKSYNLLLVCSEISC